MTKNEPKRETPIETPAETMTFLFSLLLFDLQFIEKDCLGLGILFFGFPNQFLCFFYFSFDLGLDFSFQFRQLDLTKFILADRR